MARGALLAALIAVTLGVLSAQAWSRRLLALTSCSFWLMTSPLLISSPMEARFERRPYALAGEGIRFSNYHTAANCAPSRAMLMTGVNNHLAGVPNIPEMLSPRRRQGGRLSGRAVQTGGDAR